MARRYRMCLVEGCRRRARMSQMVCKDHERTAVGITVSREVLKFEREVRSLMVAETQEERIALAKHFQQRVQRGDFAALFSGKFQELMQKGAETELTNEVGALRLAVLRLLMEEQDPTKMATALSKVANATANVLRVQEALSDKREDLEIEIERAWNAFGMKKENEERTIEARWRNVKEAEERAGEAVKRATEADRRAAEAEKRIEQATDAPEPESAAQLSDEQAFAAFMEKEGMRQQMESGLTPEMIRMGQGASREIAYEIADVGEAGAEPATGRKAAEAGPGREQWQEGYVRRLQEWEPESKG